VDEFNNWIQDYNGNKVLKQDFNCQCARDKLKNPDNGLICDDHGNYQPIQRFDELEFCVDTDGFQTTPSYPNPGPHGKKCKLGGNNYEYCPAREVECIGENGNEENCEDCKIPSCA